jgi:hypothetical protein
MVWFGQRNYGCKARSGEDDRVAINACFVNEKIASIKHAAQLFKCEIEVTA